MEHFGGLLGHISGVLGRLARLGRQMGLEVRRESVVDRALAVLGRSLLNQIQLELLSNKFNKSDKSNLDDVDSLIIHFIKNYSINDTKKLHNDLWKRISKCIEVLI